MDAVAGYLLDNLRTVQTAKQPEMTEPAARMLVAIYLHMALWTRSELVEPTPIAVFGGGAAQTARVSVGPSTLVLDGEGAAQIARVSVGPSNLALGRGGEAQTSHVSVSPTLTGNQSAGPSHDTTGVSYARRADTRSSAAARTEDYGWPDVPLDADDRVGISYIRGGVK